MQRVTVDQWVEALRSGDYVQGRTYLESPKGFCCLGVLCDLAQVPRGEPPRGCPGFMFFGPGGARSTTVIPRELRSTICCGLDLSAKTSVWINEKQFMQVLIAANDSGKTFREIADMIETEAARQASERVSQPGY